MSDRIGLTYEIEGEFVERAAGHDDPQGEDWSGFSTSDIHPGGDQSFTIWRLAPVTDAVQAEMDEQAIAVADWMLDNQGWDMIDASLQRRESRTKWVSVHEWELV